MPLLNLSRVYFDYKRAKEHRYNRGYQIAANGFYLRPNALLNLSRGNFDYKFCPSLLQSIGLREVSTPYKICATKKKIRLDFIRNQMPLLDLSRDVFDHRL